MGERGQGGWWRWWPFTLLCVAAWARWNLNDSLLGAASTAQSEALACGLAGVMCAVFALMSRSVRPELSVLVWAGFGGALLLCGPELALFVHTRSLGAGDLTIALALVPVVVAVASAALRTGGGVSTASLWPGIAAATGLLLLLPQPWVGDLRSDVVMVMAPVLTGIGCVLLYRSCVSQRAWQTTGAFTGAALVFAVGAVSDSLHRHEWMMPNLVGTGVDLVLAYLAVLSLMRLRPAQYAARYALVPLLVLVEGWVLLRPGLRLRVAGGLGLLAAGGVALLMHGQADVQEDTPPSLL